MRNLRKKTISKIEEINLNKKRERIQKTEKHINNIVENFSKLIQSLKIAEESSNVESQIGQCQIESLRASYSSQQIVLSVHSLLSMVEELKNIILVNDFKRLNEIKFDESELIEETRTNMQFLGFNKRMQTFFNKMS